MSNPLDITEDDEIERFNQWHAEHSITHPSQRVLPRRRRFHGLGRHRGRRPVSHERRPHRRHDRDFAAKSPSSPI